MFCGGQRGLVSAQVYKAVIQVVCGWHSEPCHCLPAQFRKGLERTGLRCGAIQPRARTELVLAGGLSARNVAAAISAVHPFGVDVSSGVEERRGIKSPREIARFVEAVRQEGKS